MKQHCFHVNRQGQSATIVCVRQIPQQVCLFSLGQGDVIDAAQGPEAVDDPVFVLELSQKRRLVCFREGGDCAASYLVGGDQLGRLQPNI